MDHQHAIYLGLTVHSNRLLFVQIMIVFSHIYCYSSAHHLPGFSKESYVLNVIQIFRVSLFVYVINSIFNPSFTQYSAIHCFLCMILDLFFSVHPQLHASVIFSKCMFLACHKLLVCAQDSSNSLLALSSFPLLLCSLLLVHLLLLIITVIVLLIIKSYL